MADQTKFHPHPQFQAEEPKLKAYRDLYEGDHATLCSTEYLWPHELEGSTRAVASAATGGVELSVGQKLRALRVRRSRYLNVIEPILSNWCSLAFADPPELDAQARKLLEDDGALENIDGQGTTFENFIKGPLALHYFRDGRTFLAVDAADKKFPNLAAQKLAGFRPYFEIVEALAVPDWQVGENGTFDWLRWQYVSIAKRAGPAEAPRQEEYSRVYQKTDAGSIEVQIYLKDQEKDAWKLEGEATVLKGFTEPPVSSTLTNVSWLKDLTELQLTLFNLMSAYFNQLNTQAIQRVFISGEGIGDKHQAAISEYSWIVLPKEASVQVIQPTSTDALTTAIDWTIDQMYRVAFNRSRGLTSNSNEAPGAETLREMNMELLSLLQVAVTEIEGLLNQALKHYAQFKGVKNFTGRVTLNKDLSAEDVAQRLETFITYRDEIKMLLPWRKAHLKRVVREEKYSEKEQEEIFKTIDAINDQQELETGRVRQDRQRFQSRVEEVADDGGQRSQPTTDPAGRAADSQS